MQESITPAIVSIIQSGFVDKINAALPMLTHIASGLLLLFAAIELAIFGISHAMNREGGLASLLLKVLKIGVIITLVSVFPSFLNVLAKGFMYYGHKTAAGSVSILNNPAKIWSYGFNTSISLLKISIHYGISNLSAANLYLILGFGSLLMFGLIVAQTICITLAYYVIALISLVTIPFSVITPMHGLLSKSLQQLFKAGLRILTLMVVLSLGSIAWSSASSFDITSSITGPLGFFFSTLVMLVLCIKLPKYAANAVGYFSFDFFSQSSQIGSSQATVSTSPATMSTTPSAKENSVVIATQLSADGIRTDSNGLQAGTSIQSNTSGVTPQQSVTHTTAVGSSNKGSPQGKKNSIENSAKINSRLSRESLRQLKRTLQEVINHDKKPQK